MEAVLQIEFPPRKCNRHAHAIEEVRAVRLNCSSTCATRLTVRIPRDAFNELADNRTGEKRRGSIGDSFSVTGTGSGEEENATYYLLSLDTACKTSRTLRI